MADIIETIKKAVSKKDAPEIVASKVVTSSILPHNRKGNVHEVVKGGKPWTQRNYIHNKRNVL